MTEPTGTNKIHNCVTKVADRNGEALVMVVIGLDFPDLANVDDFFPKVVEIFKNQRMCSPPETAGLFITLMGQLTTEEFKRRWERARQEDPIVGFFMTQMREASVLHGRADGSVISHISLI